MLWGILTSLAMTVCTIVDALLIGNLVGSEGLAVTNLSTPVFLSYGLFGIMLGVGANVKIGRLLGAAETEEANRVFRQVLLAGLLIGVLCWVPLFFRGGFFRLLGVTESLMPLAERYLTVVLYAAPLFILYHILSASVRTDSDPKLATAASAVVITVNLGLDLFFMLVLKMGIMGASLSLCIAEALGVLTLLSHFAKKRALLRLRLALPAWAELRGFAVNGFGIGSAYIFQAIVMLAFNTLLIRCGGADGELYVAIYGVLYSVSMVPFAVYDGAANALSTVTAFFLGEADTDSVLYVFRRALLLTVLIGAGIGLVCFVFAGQLAAFFGLPAEVAAGTAAAALRLFSVSIVFTGINTVVTAFWQAIGRAGYAGVMSVLRNFLLMLAGGFLLISRERILGLSAVYICTELVCCLLALLVRAVRGSRGFLRALCPPGGRVFEEQYEIRTGSMERISANLERICDEWEISPKTSLFINFICEELLLNIIKFGLGDKNRSYYIAIRLMEREDGTYVLRIRDNVRTFNPFETDGDEIDNGVLTLIRRKTRQYDYQRKMIFNYLYIVIG